MMKFARSWTVPEIACPRPFPPSICERYCVCQINEIHVRSRHPSRRTRSGYQRANTHSHEKSERPR